MMAVGIAGQTVAAQRPAPALLLASQLVFNIGFYAVVPFLALVTFAPRPERERLAEATTHRDTQGNVGHRSASEQPEC